LTLESCSPAGLSESAGQRAGLWQQICSMLDYRSGFQNQGRAETVERRSSGVGWSVYLVGRVDFSFAWRVCSDHDLKISIFKGTEMSLY
jgi:hypothetical protein